jgi:hypothetical protein
MKTKTPKHKKEMAANKAATKKTTSKKDVTRTDAESQCRRIIEALRAAPRTTVELCREFDILHPPARILQLRERGHVIVLHWVYVETIPKVFHRVGKYVLMSEPSTMARDG